MLEEAIHEAAWPRALELALDQWRATRLPAYADLVDELAARCPLPALSLGGSSKLVQARWLELADTYDPIAVTVLARDAWTRAAASDERFPELRARFGDDNAVIDAIVRVTRNFDAHHATDHMNCVARLAAIARWDDDPRVAPMLAELLATAPLQFAHTAGTAIYEYIANRLVTLRDVRVVPVLEGCIEEPRGQTEHIRASQKQHAKSALDRLVPPVPDRDALETVQRLHAIVARSAPRFERPDVEALWREVGANPDDDGARLVLADALNLAGDSRGQLIALQLAGGTHQQHLAARLLKREWSQWLGDLALAVMRKGTEFHRGMLERVRLGQLSTPAWVWPKLEGHRELATVRAITPGHVAPATFARVLHAIPNLRDLTIDCAHVFDTLEPLPQVATLRFRSDNPTITAPRPISYDAIFAAAARALPNLERIELGPIWADRIGQQTSDLVERAPQLFSRLRAIRISTRYIVRAPEFFAPLRDNALVELD